MTPRSLYQALLKTYGPRHWWPADSPFEMAVGAFLTQNTAWSNVEKAIAGLRQADALTAAGLSALKDEELKAFIRPAGYYNQKAERLQLFAQYLLERYEGRIETLLDQPMELARQELLRLKGIGPETADSILLYAGHHPSFVIDAYTGRLGSRLGLTDSAASYELLRAYYMEHMAAEAAVYNEYHALIVEHCKQVCRARPLCSHCFLQPECLYGNTEQAHA